MQAADEPPYLTVGTDVSAKYKGAFCEAKIKKVNRFVKCKVTFKNSQGTAIVSDDQVRGTLRIGAHVEAKHPEKNQYMEALIMKLLDYSQYTVVFDDGDETTLRRSSLCLKSGRHFAESESLDQLPLTNPEHFGTPVIGSKSRRKRRSASLNVSIDDDSSEDEGTHKRFKENKQKDTDLGKVVCVELGDKRKRDVWFPALIVVPSAQEGFRINSKDEYLVRSFKDGKYYQVSKKETRTFTKDMGSRLDNLVLKAAIDKAHHYLEQNELPHNWDRDLLMGCGIQSAEDSHDSDSDTSDDEPSEEKDRFVAQLYKFMDERGTPINRAPSVGNRDLNLYKLFKVVQKMGGYNRVTNQNQWKTVFTRMGLPNSTHATLQQLRQAHKKYLHSFEDFFRKLGCTMVTNTRSNRVRHRSDRNLIMTRNRDRDLSASRVRLQMRESKEKKRDEKSPKIELEKEEEKVRTPRTRTSCRDADGDSSKDLDMRTKETSSEEKKETRHSIRQETEPEEKKSLKRQESEENANNEKAKDRTPKQTEKTKKKVKEKKEKSSEVKKKTKAPVQIVKDEEEKVPVPKGVQLDKVKKKRIKREPTSESETSVDKRDCSFSEDEDRKMESGDSEKKGRDSAMRRQIKKKLKPKEDEPDDDRSRDSDDERDSDFNEQICNSIEIGDKLKVKYGRGKQLKIYEAKVVKVEDNPFKPFFVHYTGWNVRYDEWIRRSRIVENITKSQAKKKKTSMLKGSIKLAAKRSRSNSISPGASIHAMRKSSTPPSQQQNSRHTRSEKSNLVSGLEPRKRVRRKSGMSVVDVQASDNESGETSDACDFLDKSIDNSSGERTQDLINEPDDILPKEEDVVATKEEELQVLVKVEKEMEQEHLYNIEKEQEPEIKTEVWDNDTQLKIETPELSESPVLEKPEESIPPTVKEGVIQEAPSSPVSEIPDLVIEEAIPIPVKCEPQETFIPLKDSSLAEEILTPVMVTDTEKVVEKVSEEILSHDKPTVESENDVALGSSSCKLDEACKEDAEVVKEPEINFKMNQPISFIDKIPLVEERFDSMENSPKDSDMCSFMSRLEEIEQCDESKANIEKLINDLESPESSDASPNDSESDIPKSVDEFIVKKDLKSEIVPAFNNSANVEIGLVSSELPSVEEQKECEDEKPQFDMKKEFKKKKLKEPKPEKKLEVEDEPKSENKMKSKKRQKHEDQEDEGKQKNKKLKKNKGKKKMEPESSSEVEKRSVDGDRMKKKEKKRKEERKPLGSEVTKGDSMKKEKRKGKKKEKLLVKKNEFSGERKTKKKRKGHVDILVEVDSDKGIEPEKHSKPMKKKKGKKSKLKEDNSNNAKAASPPLKKEKKLKLELPESLLSSAKQPSENNNDGNKDLSFLLCEEKVPASPVGDTSPENDESLDSKPTAAPFVESSAGTFSGFPMSCVVKTVEKHEEVAAVLDNTPPTTPESSDSILLGTPPHEQENVCLRSMEFGNREASSANYLHESHKEDNLESEDSAQSTLSSPSGSDNDRQVSSKGFFIRQNLELDVLKKQKKSKRISSDCSTLRCKQKVLAKAKESKDIIIKAADSSDSEESQRLNSSCLFTPSMMNLTHISSVSSSQPNRPSRFNFFVPLDDYADADKRIAILQEKLSELRKAYMGLKAEVALIDRRRKKAKRKEKEIGSSSSNNSSSHSSEQQTVTHPS